MSIYLFLCEIRLQPFEEFNFSSLMLTENLWYILLIEMHRLTIDTSWGIIQITRNFQYLVLLNKRFFEESSRCYIRSLPTA